MKEPLKLGFSPCPNDTFIFDALINNKIDCGDLRFEPVMADVESLNQLAFEGGLPITKLSYSAFLQLSGKYRLLDSGSALGEGVGPLLVGKQELPKGASVEAAVNGSKIAIPGAKTTANLLLSLAFPNAKEKREVVFSEIEDRVLDGEFDLGLIIHENRFTYRSRGLVKWMDMGKWWQKESGVPVLPLGGICVRHDVPQSTAVAVQDLIKKSLAYSWSKYPDLSEFVREHAQAMDEDVMRKHIDLYVNDYSTTLGVDGRSAVNALFRLAKKSGLIEQGVQAAFI